MCGNLQVLIGQNDTSRTIRVCKKDDEIMTESTENTMKAVKPTETANTRSTTSFGVRTQSKKDICEMNDTYL